MVDRILGFTGTFGAGKGIQYISINTN